MNLREIPTNEIREVDGKSYFVQKFAIGERVIEEILWPIPTEKIISIMKPDGTLDKTLKDPLKV